MRPPVLLPVIVLRGLPLGVLAGVLLGLLFGAVEAAAQEPAASYEGRTIGRIEWTPPDQPLPLPELERLLPFHRGSVLKMDEVRAALQKLYQTGRFGNISMDADLDGDSVVLHISTELTYFVSGVTIDGASDPPNRGQLATAAKLELGLPFDPFGVDQAVQNIQERLKANGLYQAKVQYEVARDAGTEEASIHFQIDPGHRANFDGITLSGAFQKPASEIIHASAWRRGIGPVTLPGWRDLTESRVMTGLDRIRRAFQGEGQLQAQVTLEQLDYHEKTNTVTPSLNISAGPILQIRATGAKVSQGKLRQLIPVYQEHSVDRSLLIEGERNLTEYFQSQGYFDARVDFNESNPQSGIRAIDYSIDRNGRHKLVHIGITGNHFFDQATLRERLSLIPASFPRYRFGRYSQKLVDQDRTAIGDLYRSNGFREVDVTAKTTDDYLGRQGQIAVDYEIQEGAQWFVNSLTLEGISEPDQRYLRTILQSIEDQAFSEVRIAADRDTVLSYYYNNGYPEATFDWTEAPGPSSHQVNLHFVIHPGPRLFVRQVLIHGLSTTNRTLVANRILLGPGDPISQSRIADSQQKLYDLGIFSKVQTAIQNPAGEEERKYVLFQIEEASKYSFNAGFGAELARIGGGVTTFDAPAGTTGFSPRISLGISRLNFLGLAHTLSLQTLASTLEQRAVLSYLAPQFTGNPNLSLTFSALFDDSRDVRTFAARRWEGSVQLAQRISRSVTMQYRFAFRRVTVDENTLKISPELIPLLSQPVRVGQYSMSFIQDRRDDPTNSHRGMYNAVDVGISLPQFGSETDFSRILLRNSTYHRIGKDVVIARTLQFGYMERLGGLAEIPLAERFFAGGASSQRAFPDNQAGPRDLETGFPLGGNALLFHQTELRFPLLGNNIGGVLFHDIGNVYSDIRDLTLRFRQRNIEDFNYTVQAVGFGIRYRTPVGPIRVDLSFSPDSPRFFGFQGTRDELLAGQGTLTNQRINMFQFHFSLGQTF